MLREGLQRKLLRSPLLLAVTGLLGLLRKLPARTCSARPCAVCVCAISPDS